MGPQTNFTLHVVGRYSFMGGELGYFFGLQNALLVKYADELFLHSTVHVCIVL